MSEEKLKMGHTKRNIFSILIISGMLLMLPLLANGQDLTQQREENKLHSPRNISELIHINQRIEKVVEVTRPAVVGLSIRIMHNGEEREVGGSGTIISPEGYIATAAHVAYSKEAKCLVHLTDGRKVKASVVNLNRDMDYALLRMQNNPPDLSHTPLGNSDTLYPGEWIIAMGHPLGVERFPFRKPVVRAGRVTGFHNNKVYMDAPLISGDSGGPVFNLDGELVGINVSIAIDDVTSNHFCPIHYLKDNLHQLLENEDLTGDSRNLDDYLLALTEQVYDLGAQGKFDDAVKLIALMIEEDAVRPTTYYHWACLLARRNQDGDSVKAIELLNKAISLGWTDWKWMNKDPDWNALRNSNEFQEAILRMHRRLDYPAKLGVRIQPTPDRDGVIIQSVSFNGAAAKAGLQLGDRITHINSNYLRNADELYQEIRQRRAGDVITIRYKRGYSEIDHVVDITLHGMPTEEGDLVRGKYRNGAEIRNLLSSLPHNPQHAVVNILQNNQVKSSGIVVRADGIILTKKSEITANIPIRVGVGPGNVAQLPALIIAEDEEVDLVLLKVDAENLPIIRFNIESVKEGTFITSFDGEQRNIGCGYISLSSYIARQSNQIPMVGAILGEMSDEEKEKIGLEGLIVRAIRPGTPASRADLRYGDIVLKVDQKHFLNEFDYMEYLYRLDPQREVRFDISRLGTEMTISIKLGSQADNEEEGSFRESFMGRRIIGPSSRRYTGFGDVIVHDMVLEPRQMGSPILDIEGKVIGINIARNHRASTYALSSSRLVALLPKLLERGDIALSQLPKDY